MAPNRKRFAMTLTSASLFDPQILPTVLDTDDVDTLVSFYEMFVLVTRDSWQEIAVFHAGSDFSRVKGIAHKLKSSSATIGAMQLAEALKVLEDLAASRDADAVRRCIAETAEAVSDAVNTVQCHMDAMRQSSGCG